MPFYERDGVRLHYVTIGSPDLPAVLLLHGFTSDHRMWQPVATEVAQSYYVVAPDLRGHGQSDAPARIESYSMDAYVEDIAELMRVEDIAVSAIVGCSFGGMVAMNFALAHPEHVAALVLSDTSPARERPEYDDAFRNREARIDAMVETATRLGAAGLARRMAAQAKNEFASEALYQRYARLSTDGLAGAAHARNTRPDVTGRLSSLTMPVMLVAGTDDPVSSAMPLMEARLPESRRAWFEETGHGVPSLRPDDFANELLDFLADAESGRQIAGERHIGGPGRRRGRLYSRRREEHPNNGPARPDEDGNT